MEVTPLYCNPVTVRAITKVLRSIATEERLAVYASGKAADGLCLQDAIAEIAESSQGDLRLGVYARVSLYHYYGAYM